MTHGTRDLKWKLNDLEPREHENVGVEGIALLTIGVMAFAAVIFGSIIFCLINLAAEKIVSWNVFKVIKTALDKIKKLDEELFYGKNMTKW